MYYISRVNQNKNLYMKNAYSNYILMYKVMEMFNNRDLDVKFETFCEDVTCTSAAVLQKFNDKSMYNSSNH